MPNRRQQLTENDLEQALSLLEQNLLYRADQKGLGCFASGHEILGVVMQETSEFEAEVHARSSNKRKISELLDIAVACLWGLASIESNGVDW